jgi:hypothetical protein
MRIILCAPGSHFPREWVIHWTNLVTQLRDMGHEILISLQYSSFVSFARAQCLGADVLAGVDQKPFHGMPYDKIVFIDSDVLVTVEQVVALLQSPHPITTGMYIMADNKNYAIVEKWDTEYYSKTGTFKFITPEYVEQWKQEHPSSHYMEVSYAGMGIMAISHGVFENERFKYPWFFRDIETIISPEGKMVRDGTSEDASFCRNLQEIGVKIYVDVRVKCPHLKMVPLIR